MMSYIGKKVFLLCAVLLSVTMMSCQKEGVSGFLYNEGYLNFTVSKDINVDVSTKSDPVVFAVTITNQAGEVVASYADHTQIPEQVTLKVGKYKIRATNGRDVSAAFDTPFYAGETEIEISKGKTTAASVVCTLANVKVCVTFSPAIKNAMKSYVVSVTNEDGGVLVFNPEEARSGYFKCSGKLTWNINMTTKNGVDFALIRTVKEVKAREFYTFEFNIDENGDPNSDGENTDIEYDEALNEQKHHIDIILSKKTKPIVEGAGFDIKQPATAYFGKQNECTVNVTAAAQVYSMEIKHSSEFLVSLGIPVKFNLINSDLLTLETVKQAGITWSTPVDEASQVSLHFGQLTSVLPLGKYDFEINVLDFQNQLVTQKLQIEVTPKVDVVTMDVNAWAMYATLRGRWVTLQQPDSLGFLYKAAGSVEWISVPQSDVTLTGEKTFSARILVLTPATEYVFKAVSAGENGNDAEIVSFTTESATQLPNMRFDSWYKDSKTWYARDASEGLFWDSGNKGANTLSEVNPTTPEESIVVSGKAGRLASKVAAGVFAAGNIYAGQFIKAVLSPMGAELDFGRPYTSRPSQLKGYYRYQPGTINKNSGNYGHLNGTQDSCIMWVALCDWSGPFRVSTASGQFVDVNNDPNIIAYGMFAESKTMDAYEEFTIDLKYRDTTRKAKYVIVVASASKYGDYFTGSTSSVLYIDEFEFIFEPPK